MDPKISVRTDFAVGERAKITKTVSEKDLIMFAKVVKDYNPLHFDSDFADRRHLNGRGLTIRLESC